MIKNYLKIAWRNLWRNKAFSAINIFGLAMGLAICMLITLFVVDELTYDQFNEKADRIYRINTDIQLSGSTFNDRVTPAPMAAVLIKDYPQIEQAVRIRGGGNMLVKKGNETVIEPNSFSADATLFDVFTLPMIVGNPKSALSQPNSMVISESIALKYFNSTDVIGKTLKIDNTTLYKITGVIKDTPPQSHLHFSFIKSLVGDEEGRSDFWLRNNFTTYILARPGTNQQSIEGYLKEVAKKYAEPQLQGIVHSSFDDLAKKGDHFRYTSIPLTAIHLHSPLTSELEPSGNIRYVYIFTIIAVFILLIACVNFMNLSTARSAGRSKEVGVRKVMGSSRLALVIQFLSESVLTSFIALLFAITFATLLLPYLNSVSGKTLTLYQASSLRLLPALLLATLFVGLLAGLYPAFFLSAFKPVQVLKGKMAAGFKGSWLRNGLVVFQFATAIILIVGTLVIYSQLNYIRNKNLGYNREQVLVLQNAYSLGEHAKTFKNEVLQIPGVVAGTRTGALPTSTLSDWNKNAFSKDASMNAGQSVTLVDWSVDADFIPAMGMELVKGRNFSSDMPTDSSAFIINETAARLLGYKNPLKEKLYDYNLEKKNAAAYAIIGVVKDFNAGSMRYKTEPMIFRLSKYGDRIAFRIQSKNIKSVIAQIEQKYHSMEAMADQPFLYSFMDEDFDRLYNAEQRTGKIFMSFAFFAIAIACLGLFGLVTYAAEQRTKEIGIRKVLGANVISILRLLSYDFLKLVIIAILIAFPIAWWGMNNWLQDFAYRTTISWWLFVLAALSAIGITLLTISYQAIKAALANPVKSLRTE